MHFYISQSDKGELVIGGDLDFCNSYSQRGNLPIIEHVVSARPGAVPELRAAARCCAPGAASCDMSMDGSPIIGNTPVKGLT